MKLKAGISIKMFMQFKKWTEFKNCGRPEFRGKYQFDFANDKFLIDRSLKK